MSNIKATHGKGHEWTHEVRFIFDGFPRGWLLCRQEGDEWFVDFRDCIAPYTTEELGQCEFRRITREVEAAIGDTISKNPPAVDVVQGIRSELERLRAENARLLTDNARLRAVMLRIETLVKGSK